MTALSDYLENQLLRWAMTNDATITRPTTWYIALFSTATTDAGGGTEITGGSYARQAATFSVTGSTATNTGVIEFASTADWPNITHVAITTALTGGNYLWHGPLSAARDPSSGDIIRFAIGQLSVSLD